MNNNLSRLARIVRHALGSGILLAAFAASVASAQIPAGYYADTDGKSGAALKTALHGIIAPHTQVSYDGLWEAYEVTDVVPGTDDQVFDMFSPTVHYYSSRGSDVNREHVCPQSWWGGGNRIACYSDLFNVYPSEAKANSAKGNFPLGRVTDAVTYDNGRITVGKADESGGATYVVEPCDEFKGDFARVYFYVATCYQATAWEVGYAFTQGGSTYPTLEAWIIPLLIEWHNADPVSDWEIERQEKVYAWQRNRNPFIDYPVLADHIWGNLSEAAFDLATAKLHAGANGQTGPRCATPRYAPDGGKTPATALHVGPGTTVTLTTSSTAATLYYRTTAEAAWDSVCAAADNASPSVALVLEADAAIEAWVRRDGYQNSDTTCRYYAVDVPSDYLLYEDFDEITTGDNITTGGSSTTWDGNDNFTPNATVYQAGGAVRLASSSKAGTLTSRPLAYAGGIVTVEVDVKGWSSVEGPLTVSVSGADSQTLTYTSTMKDAFETCTATFTGCADNPVVTIEAAKKQRAFIDAVRVRGVVSAIETVRCDDASAGDIIYDMAGRRWKTLPAERGFYIVNGKKIFKL